MQMDQERKPIPFEAEKGALIAVIRAAPQGRRRLRSISDLAPPDPRPHLVRGPG
jgi:hypothetical protein